MVYSFQKEINEILRKRSKCLDKGDYEEAARLSNRAGEVCFANRAFTEACSYHQDEAKYSEVANDKIGEAVAHRKIGECFCEEKLFEKALLHQREHLRIARECNNLTEEQRALATIGRTLYLKILESENSGSDATEALSESQKAYLESLAICDKLKTVVSEKELLEMRSRLYLNLGLLFEYRNEFDEALRFIKKALVTSTEFKFRETMYRCYYSLSGLYYKLGKESEALQCSRQAQKLGKELGDPALESDAWIQLAQALIVLGNFQGCREALKAAHKLSKFRISVDSENVFNLFRLAFEGEGLLEQLNDSDAQQKFETYDRLGDLYSECKALGLAIGCYKKQLDLSVDLGLQDKPMCQVLVSLAVTYSENKNFDEAIEWYNRELELRKGEYKESTATYCAIAKVQEDSGCDIDTVKETYYKAIESAEKSNYSTVKKKAYKEFLDTLLNNGLVDEASSIESKLQALGETSNEDEDESESQDSKKRKFILKPVEILRLLEDEGEESEEEGIIETEISGSISGKRKSTSIRRSARKKIKKVNEKGETPLHTSCIAGNLKEVGALLHNGADVNARDYCGWQPLHEAANHGHSEIVDMLLRAGAHVNDPGGQHCHGVTPLHDASQNGHLSTVKVLIKHGANPTQVDTFGQTPSDLVKEAIKGQEEEDVQESEIMENRKAVLSYLTGVVQQALPTCDKVRKRNLLISDEEDSPDTSIGIFDRKNTRQPYESQYLPTAEDGFLTPQQNCWDSNSEKDEVEGNLNLHDTTPSFSKSRCFSNKNLSKRILTNDLKSQSKPAQTNLIEKYPLVSEIKDKFSPHSSSAKAKNGVLDDFLVDDLARGRNKVRYSSTAFPHKRGRRRQTTTSADKKGQILPTDKGVINTKEKRKNYQPCIFQEKFFIDREPDTSKKGHGRSHSSQTSKVTCSGSSLASEVTRVRVKIGENLFLVPCLNSSTISSLKSEIINRSKSFFSECPQSLNLYTEEGALLHEDDKVSYVLDDNAVVVVDLGGTTEEDNIDSLNTDVDEIIQFMEDSWSLELKGELLDVADMDCMSHVFMTQSDTHTLIVKGCFFTCKENPAGLESLKKWIDSITYIHNLKDLDLSSTYVNQGIRLLTSHLEKQFKNNQYPFRSLETLNLSQWRFPADPTKPLAILFSSCYCLKLLSLSDCQLDLDRAFCNRDVSTSFKGLQYLETLNLSGNTLCKDEHEYRASFFRTLTGTSVATLNLKNTKYPGILEKIFLDDIALFLSKTRVPIASINLSGCFQYFYKYSTDSFWNTFRLKESAVTVDFSQVDFGLKVVETISKAIPFWVSLTNLILSGNKHFDTDCFETIIRSLGQSGCSLRRLDISRTPIQSPLPLCLYTSIGDCDKLVLLDLSQCNIWTSDQNKLLVTWKQIHNSNDGVVSDFLFLLTRSVDS